MFFLKIKSWEKKFFIINVFIIIAYKLFPLNLRVVFNIFTVGRNKNGLYVTLIFGDRL